MDTILGAATSSADLIKDGSTASFAEDVIQASATVPVMVDFWAPWCGPCKQLTPLLEKIVREARGAVKLVKINVDEEQNLAAQLRVQSVPTVYAFKDGRPFDAFTGAVAESQLRSFVQRLTEGVEAPPSIADMVEAANQTLAAGHLQEAIGMFTQILTEEPENTAAMGGIVRVLVAAQELDRAKAYLDDIPSRLADKQDIAVARSTLELALSAQKVGPLDELQHKVDADPADHAARFDLALALYAAGQVESAIDQLLELFRRDRNWNEQAAKTQLLQIFESLGFEHPLALSGRRQMSALMFS